MAVSVEMLHSLQQRLLSLVPDSDEVGALATELFQTSGSQAGFVVIARRLLAKAIVTNKGGGYNSVKEYTEEVLATLTRKNAEADVDLLSARVDMWIRWKLQSPRGRIDWALIGEDFRKILSFNRFRDDVIKNYYYGVVLFHFGDLAQANAVFRRLRRMTGSSYGKGTLRNFLVGKEGFPRRLQGTLRSGHGRWYVDCGELGADVEVHGYGKPQVSERATVHFYLGFSMIGPFAQFQSPHPEDLVLP